jgi:xanthine/CO dehydrogenase XdhC/CoxF family maturation factor
MSELQAILAAYFASDEAAFLATVVHTNGSTYRRTGARSLIRVSGEMVGMVSGGCLEADIFAQTQQRMPDEKPILVTYDHTAAEDILWGFGLGCKGVVQVLIERLEQRDHLNPLTFIRDCFERQASGAIATVIHSSTVALGSRVLLPADGRFRHDIENAQLRSRILTDLRSALHQRRPLVKTYSSAEVLIEPIHPPRSLLIFGAGLDAIPVMQFAKQLGWTVTIVDCRASEATFERFSIADQIILTRREKLAEQVPVNQQTIAVVMTHNYFDDLEILRMLLPRSILYIGALGPKRRAESLLQDLKVAGIRYSNVQLEKLYAPIGLEIGAETPEAIALSILAEIQAVLSDRTGGHLKHRTGAIHDSDSALSPRLDGFSGGSLDPHENAQTVATHWGT